MPIPSVNRRDFMRLGALGATAAGLGINPLDAAAKPVAPSDKITVGMIAVGARAHQLINLMNGMSDVEVVAVCDAYDGRIERAISRTEGRAKAYDDYRKIIERSDVDTVVIAIGHNPNSLISKNVEHLKTNNDGTLKVNEKNGMTLVSGVFAAGNVRTNAGPVIGAITSGKKAAQEIDDYLK